LVSFGLDCDTGEIRTDKIDKFAKFLETVTREYTKERTSAGEYKVQLVNALKSFKGQSIEKLRADRERRLAKEKQEPAYYKSPLNPNGKEIGTKPVQPPKPAAKPKPQPVVYEEKPKMKAYTPEFVSFLLNCEIDDNLEKTDRMHDELLEIFDGTHSRINKIELNNAVKECLEDAVFKDTVEKLEKSKNPDERWDHANKIAHYIYTALPEKKKHLIGPSNGNNRQTKT
jgi:hypothetical protein